MNTIGVVVTVYNMEDYIEQCINSIINQRYHNIEIVIIDDGSVDRSGIICDKLAEKDKRIQVFHQKNQGPIMARLHGVELLKAQYVSFIDGDDWIDENCYGDIVESGYLGKADMISFGIIRYHGCNDVREEKGVFASRFYSDTDISNIVIPKLFWDKENQDYGMDPSLCSKIFKKQYLLEQLYSIRNMNIYYGEDIATIYPIALNIHSLAVIDKCYYFHRLRKSNQTPAYILDMEYLPKLYKLYSYLKPIFNSSPYKEQLNKQLDYFYIYSVQLVKMKYGDFSFEEKYMFPFNKVKVNSRIVLYGAGKVGQTFYRELQRIAYCEVVGWVDKDAERYNRKEITDIEKLDQIRFDYVVVAIDSKKTSDIVKTCLENKGIDKEKIVTL